MVESKVTNEPWTLLKKVSQKEMTILIEAYVPYADKMKYVRYIILGVAAVIAGYYFFVTGMRFPLGKLNNIQIGFASVMGLFVLALLVLLWGMTTTLRKVKKSLNSHAAKYKIDKKAFRKEFHTFIKTTIDGPGLR